MFGKVAKKLEGVMLSGSVEVWFSEGVLALSKASEKVVCGWLIWSRSGLCVSRTAIPEL